MDATVPGEPCNSSLREMIKDLKSNSRKKLFSEYKCRMFAYVMAQARYGFPNARRSARSGLAGEVGELTYYAMERESLLEPNLQAVSLTGYWSLTPQAILARTVGINDSYGVR
jgi:hypothetical protein